MAAKAAKKTDEKCTRIKFEYRGESYVLEFDRDTIVATERGYDVSVRDLSTAKIGAIKGAFAGAFLKNHPGTDDELIDEIWGAMPEKVELARKLTRMYVEGYNSLVSVPDEGNAISWTAE